MRTFESADYGPVLAPLVDRDRCRPLDAGQPTARGHGALHSANVATAFAHARPVELDMARCCLAGVWLLHDFLDQSHAISQGVETSAGSFWHGVMHRREGDFSNAKYWFRRVGPHEVLEALGPRVVELGDAHRQPELAGRIAPDGRFDPLEMVDACQAALRSGGVGEAFCRRVQQAEWELLFHHCYQTAIGVRRVDEPSVAPAHG